MSRLGQIEPKSPEVKKKDDPKDKKKDKEKEAKEAQPKKLIGYDNDVVLLDNAGVLISNSSRTMSLAAAELFDPLFKAKSNILIGENYR